MIWVFVSISASCLSGSITQRFFIFVRSNRNDVYSVEAAEVLGRLTGDEAPYWYIGESDHHGNPILSSIRRRRTAFRRSRRIKGWRGWRKEGKEARAIRTG